MTVWESIDATRDPSELALMVVMLIAGSILIVSTWWICTSGKPKGG
jgi:hypothetical protein